jgi:hypothetical protein
MQSVLDGESDVGMINEQAFKDQVKSGAFNDSDFEFVGPNCVEQHVDKGVFADQVIGPGVYMASVPCESHFCYVRDRHDVSVHAHTIHQYINTSRQVHCAYMTSIFCVYLCLMTATAFYVCGMMKHAYLHAHNLSLFTHPHAHYLPIYIHICLHAYE